MSFELTPFLRSLQLSDSSLPIGRFTHSLGLEALLAFDPGLDPVGLTTVIESLVIAGSARLDGAAVAHAHRKHSSGDLDGLIALDRAVTARKLAYGPRRASAMCGRQLAELSETLTRDRTMESFRKAIRVDQATGNLAVVEGALGSALGLDVESAVAIELRGTASSLISAAVRLGRLSASRGQRLLLDVEEVIATATGIALACPEETMGSSAIELEIHAMRHSQLEGRLFIS